jgi:CubicO group peptidase (beta-lactamase class C family)
MEIDMASNRFYLLASFAVLFVCRTEAAEIPRAKPEDVGMSSAKLAEIETALAKLVEDDKAAGVITLVARRGKIVHASAIGKRDVENDLPMIEDTIVRIFSMTKPITSTAAMMLAEEGKLSLDDPVHKHLPEFKDIRVYRGNSPPEASEDAGLAAADEPSGAPPDAVADLPTVALDRDVTVRDLLRHTSGLTYGFLGFTPVDAKYRAADILESHDLKEMVEKLGRLPLLHQPATRFHYSVSTDVLGRLVEVVSGRPFGEFLTERILTPLDMRDTAFFVPPEKHDRVAAVYEAPGLGIIGGLRRSEDQTMAAFLREPTLYSGGGGLVGTARDYMRFCQMLVNRGELGGVRLLQAETVEQMTTNQLPQQAYPIAIGPFPRAGVGFGLGFSVVVEKQTDAPYIPVGEYGWGGAASTHFWISPEHELAVVALTQRVPFSFAVEETVKPIVYSAIVEGREVENAARAK